jgi:hypothetical protein
LHPRARRGLPPADLIARRLPDADPDELRRDEDSTVDATL